jgi:hypothetical protein
MKSNNGNQVVELPAHSVHELWWRFIQELTAIRVLLGKSGRLFCVLVYIPHVKLLSTVI